MVLYLRSIVNGQFFRDIEKLITSTYSELWKQPKFRNQRETPHPFITIFHKRNGLRWQQAKNIRKFIWQVRYFKAYNPKVLVLFGQVNAYLRGQTKLSKKMMKSLIALWIYLFRKLFLMSDTIVFHSRQPIKLQKKFQTRTCHCQPGRLSGLKLLKFEILQQTGEIWSFWLFRGMTLPKHSKNTSYLEENHSISCKTGR